jgi:hypothetical protein
MTVGEEKKMKEESEGRRKGRTCPDRTVKRRRERKQQREKEWEKINNRRRRRRKRRSDETRTMAARGKMEQGKEPVEMKIRRIAARRRGRAGPCSARGAAPSSPPTKARGRMC